MTPLLAPLTAVKTTALPDLEQALPNAEADVDFAALLDTTGEEKSTLLPDPETTPDAPKILVEDAEPEVDTDLPTLAKPSQGDADPDRVIPVDKVTPNPAEADDLQALGKTVFNTNDADTRTALREPSQTLPLLAKETPSTQPVDAPLDRPSTPQPAGPDETRLAKSDAVTPQAEQPRLASSTAIQPTGVVRASEAKAPLRTSTPPPTPALPVTDDNAAIEEAPVKDRPANPRPQSTDPIATVDQPRSRSARPAITQEDIGQTKGVTEKAAPSEAERDVTKTISTPDRPKAEAPRSAHPIQFEARETNRPADPGMRAKIGYAAVTPAPVDQKNTHSSRIIDPKFNLEPKDIKTQAAQPKERLQVNESILKDQKGPSAPLPLQTAQPAVDSPKPPQPKETPSALQIALQSEKPTPQTPPIQFAETPKATPVSVQSVVASYESPRTIANLQNSGARPQQSVTGLASAAPVPTTPQPKQSFPVQTSADPFVPIDKSDGLIRFDAPSPVTERGTMTPTSPQQPTSPEQARHVAQQLATAMPTTLPGTTEINLNPEELGRVRMTLTVQDGAMTLIINAERPETTDLMRRHIDQLMQTYRQMGFDTLNLSFAGSAQREAPAFDDAADLPDDPEAVDIDTQTPPSAAAPGEGRLDLRM